MSSVKRLVETSCLKSLPSNYVFNPQSVDLMAWDNEEEEIPVIDFSLLMSSDSHQRSKVIKDIGYACREWGFFMVINHGVPEELKEEMLGACQSLFDLTEKEKLEYAGKSLFDPIRIGTSFNVTVDKQLFWRDYLKVHVHPHFHAPHKPPIFREISEEYCKRAREVAQELLKGISESLGLEDDYINEKMEVGLGSQLLVVNLYPPCPQPAVAMGLPPHSDHGLLTLLMQNEQDGLQVLHNGTWVPITPLPNSFIVNTGDHLEILTNGKYKSVIHRAMVNNEATRISIGTAHGPPLDKIVSPAPELVAEGGNHLGYRGIKYKEYLELQQSNQLNGKDCVEYVRL